MDQALSTYINKLSASQREKLLELRQFIVKLLPDAEEKMSYGVPSFRQHGRSILYGVFKHHLGIYPQPEVIEHFKAELSRFETSKGTVKFRLDQPLPFDLLKRMIVYMFTSSKRLSSKPAQP